MPIRETFWNIPHWAEVSQYVLGLLSVLILVVGATTRIKRWRKGKPVKVADRIGTRLWSVITQAIGQIRTAENAFAGVMHLMIFWGMVTLVLGTALATIDWDVTHLFFDFQFLKGGVYVVYELMLDILGLLLVVGLGMAAYRRYVSRPEYLKNDEKKSFAFDDAYAIVMLLLIAVSGYLVEGLRIAVTQPSWARWSPVGNALATLFINMDVANQHSFHLIIWSIHGLIAFGLIASVPFTKFFHIIAAPVNIFYRKLDEPGRLDPEVEGGDVGVQKWTDFTWKQLLDIEACIRCGRCVDNCPSYASGLPLAPRTVNSNLRQQMWASSNGKDLYEDVVTLEEIWACTTCFACVRVCPVFTNFVSSMVDMRRHVVFEGWVDSELQDALANLGRYGNSFGQSPRARAKWTQGFAPKIKDARREPVEYLWFLGDYASYHPALAEVTRKTAEVFQRAGLDFGILYDAEQNAGNDVRRVGEEGLFEMLVEKNQRSLGRSQFQTIITTDPHTYNTLKNEYPSEHEGYRVVHYTELLAELIQSGKIQLTNKSNGKVTYHDPCYLGRYNDIYDQPRDVIKAAGGELVEMERNRDRALCCGAGGGRIWMEEGDVKERPSEMRIREAVSNGEISTMIVTCPKDLVMFQDAVKTTGNEDRLVIKDLIDLVYEAM
ncbi:MAG: heterodisulfide reductase-related iron-sulfur binding cluster [Anaerolineales bacterium]|jgi:Fe-S oxidoreductase/nitrate reductase gamma subunit